MTQAGTRSATPSAVPRFTRLEAVDPADVARDRGIDPLAYLPDMDVTDSPVLDELLARAAAFDFDAATEADVRAALAADRLSPEGFGALLFQLSTVAGVLPLHHLIVEHLHLSLIHI